MAARKSLTFLNTILPVTKSHDEVVKKKLKPGKFVFTPAGIIKILGAVCLLAAITFFAASSACGEEADWRRYLFLISNALTILVTVVLYLVFSFGYTVKNPWFWVKTDILLNVLLPVASIVCSTVATWACSSTNQLHKLPEPLAVAGGVVLIVSAAALALLYRYKEEEEEQRSTETPRQGANTSSTETDSPEGRKSIFA